MRTNTNQITYTSPTYDLDKYKYIAQIQCYQYKTLTHKHQANANRTQMLAPSSANTKARYRDQGNTMRFARLGNLEDDGK